MCTLLYYIYVYTYLYLTVKQSRIEYNFVFSCDTVSCLTLSQDFAWHFPVIEAFATATAAAVS